MFDLFDAEIDPNSFRVQRHIGIIDRDRSVNDWGKSLVLGGAGKGYQRATVVFR
jgi:hypothetical protein